MLCCSGMLFFVLVHWCGDIMNADLKAACSDYSVFVVFHCCRIGMIVFVFPLIIFVLCSCVRSCWLVLSLVCWLVGLFVPVSVSRLFVFG